MKLKMNLKDIYETKFIVFGVVWSVWDWTVFVFILAFIVVISAVAFFCCWCCYPERYQEEKEAEEDQDAKSKAETDKEVMDAEAKLSAKLAAAGAATMEAPERDVKDVVESKKFEVPTGEKPMEEMMME